MIRVQDRERASRKPTALDRHLASHGLGWAATAVMLAATVVIAFVAPV